MISIVSTFSHEVEQDIEVLGCKDSYAHWDLIKLKNKLDEETPYYMNITRQQRDLLDMCITLEHTIEAKFKEKHQL